MSDKQIGVRIRKLREEKKMTREELANKTKITAKFLYEVESGKKGLSANNLIKISTALSSSCDYILLGVHNLDEGSDIEEFFSELLKGFDDKQRKITIKILSKLIEIS